MTVASHTNTTRVSAAAAARQPDMSFLLRWWWMAGCQHQNAGAFDRCFESSIQPTDSGHSMSTGGVVLLDAAAVARHGVDTTAAAGPGRVNGAAAFAAGAVRDSPGDRLLTTAAAAPRSSGSRGCLRARRRTRRVPTSPAAARCPAPADMWRLKKSRSDFNCG